MAVRYLTANQLLSRLLELKKQGSLDNYWVEIELEDESSHILVDEPFDRDSTDGLIIIQARKQI